MNVGLALFSFGYMHKKTENWKLAIESFERALTYLLKDTDHYFMALYHKIHAIIQAKLRFSAYQELEQAKITCGTSEVWAIYFEALEHCLRISHNMSGRNYKSIDYIENVAIPHFHKMDDHLIALDCYILLEQHYMASRRIKKSLEASKKMTDVYKRVYANDRERVEI